MKLLVLLIIILLLAYNWWPESQPRPVEKTFIGEQMAPLQKAQKFQQEDHLKALDQHREKMDAQLDADG